MQEIKRTQAMIERNAAPGDAGAAAKEEDKTLTPAELARKQAKERTDALLPVPELRPLEPGADPS